MQNLNLIEIGASTAYANTIAGTIEQRSVRRSAYFEHGSFINTDFKPLIVAFQNPETLSVFSDRIAQLTHEALEDFVNRLETSKSIFDGMDVDVYICLPCISEEQRITGDLLTRLAKNADYACRQVLTERLGISVCNVSLLSQAQPSIGLLFSKYFNHERNVGVRPFIIVAVDSYNDARRLNCLNDQGKLFSNKHRYGLVPGEAAVVGLFASSEIEFDGYANLCRILSAEIGFEEVLENMEAETQFKGLSTACLNSTEKLDADPCPEGIHHWYSDWNNGRYRATELAFAIHRTNANFPSPNMEIEYPSIQFGDCGAAYAMLSIAIHSMASEIGGEKLSIISASSTYSQLRSSILVL